MTYTDYNKLHDAYGNAGKIPDLLNQAALYPICNWDEEPYFSLWSSLCHQGDIYSASIVAVPRLIEIASHAPAERIQDAYHLATSIIIAHALDEDKKLAAYAQGEFTSAVKKLQEIGIRLLGSTSDTSWKRVALAGISASAGEFRLANFILNSEDDLICPSCEEAL